MVLSTLLISCALRAHEPEGAPPERPAPVSAAEAKVPRELIERVEGEYRASLKRPTETLVKHSLLRLSVDFASEKPGVLEESAVFKMPPGGGTFDLATVVGHKPGAFNLRLTLGDEAGTRLTPARVYFVPHARARRIEGETFGDGCGKYLDLTGAFLKRFGPKGFDLFTAGRRYLSTVAGTFLFAVFDQKTLQVAHVTFTDARYPQLLCE